MTDLWAILGAIALLVTLGGVCSIANSSNIDSNPYSGTAFCGGLLFLVIFASLAAASGRRDREKLAEWKTDQQLAVQREIADQQLAVQQQMLINQQQQLAMSRQPVATSYIPDPFQDPEAELRKASDLIKAKRYAEARAILLTVDHPKAREWISRIDAMPAK